MRTDGVRSQHHAPVGFRRLPRFSPGSFGAQTSVRVPPSRCTSSWGVDHRYLLLIEAQLHLFRDIAQDPQVLGVFHPAPGGKKHAMIPQLHDINGRDGLLEHRGYIWTSMISLSTLLALSRSFLVADGHLHPHPAGSGV